MGCPLEKDVAALLDELGIPYERHDKVAGCGLDFYLTRHRVHVEVKRFHTPRISGQLARRRDVIVIQGIGAVQAFRALLSKKD